MSPRPHLQARTPWRTRPHVKAQEVEGYRRGLRSPSSRSVSRTIPKFALNRELPENRRSATKIRRASTDTQQKREKTNESSSCDRSAKRPAGRGLRSRCAEILHRRFTRAQRRRRLARVHGGHEPERRAR